MRSRELGRRLRVAQEQAGFTGAQLAHILGWTPTAMSRTLTGHRPTRDVDVSAFLAVCHVIGQERDRTLALCRPHADLGFLRLSGNEQWTVYLAHAKAATSLIEFQPLIVPWMVQVPAYTGALLADSSPADGDIEERVLARRDATALLRVPRSELWLHEFALRNPVGDDAVMSDQLHHLLRLSVRPTLSIRVIPVGLGSHAMLYGAFTVLDFADYASTVYREDSGGGALLDHHEEVAPCRSAIDHVRRLALDEQASRDLIADIAITLYGHRAKPSVARFTEACVKHPSEHDQVPRDPQVPSEACRREDPDLRSAP